MNNLIYNVYCTNSIGEIETRNILSYEFLTKNILKLVKEYKKALKQFNNGGDYSYHTCRIDFNIKPYNTKSKLDQAFKDKVLSPTLRSELMYHFWSRCEYELILSSWPSFITKEELSRLNNEYESDISKGYNPFRCNVNIDKSLKVDIFNQIEINWDPFISYIWVNYFEDKRGKWYERMESR